MLADRDHAVALERTTTGQPLSDADARDLLDRASRVVIARGRSVRELDGSAVDRDDLKGPTGKYRAPMLLAGDTLLVGFSVPALEETLDRLSA